MICQFRKLPGCFEVIAEFAGGISQAEESVFYFFYLVCQVFFLSRGSQPFAGAPSAHIVNSKM